VISTYTAVTLPTKPEQAPTLPVLPAPETATPAAAMPASSLPPTGGETVPSHVGPIVIVGGIIAILIALLSLLLPKKRKGSKIRRIVLHNLRQSY
jgi:hypothetical protein